MFKLGGTLFVLVFLTSCAQIFDTSVFQNVDSAPSLSPSSLSTASVTQIHDLLKDPNIYTELENNSSALSAVVTNLTGVISSSSSSTSDKATAYRTLILIGIYASPAGTVVNNDLAVFIPLLTNGGISTTGTPPSWIQSTASSLFAGLTQSQIEQALTNFSSIDTLFQGLFTLTKTSSGGITSDFYGTDNNADLAQIGTVASLGVLLLDLCYSDNVRTSDFILTNNTSDVNLSAFISPSSFLTELNDFTGTFSGTSPTTYTYYLQPLSVALKF